MDEVVDDGASFDPRDVVRLAVYPPIGIARVGDTVDAAPDDYLVSPEVVGGMPTRPDGQPALDVKDYRGSDHGLRRHAARFRVYAELRDGSFREVVHQGGVSIEWSVAVANLKAGWYEFNQAMDLPPKFARAAAPRNAGFAGDRAALDITPAAAVLSSSQAVGTAAEFSGGTFVGRPVYLGEIRIDTGGRLLVLGGRGKAASLDGSKPTTFANNVGWHDDVSDGPVRASVRFPDGSAMSAEPGYVAVTPPNNAPGIVGVVTMDDTVREVFFDKGWLPRPTATSFTEDIWPIFRRLTDMQWINHGLFIVHGFGSTLDAHDPSAVQQLRDAAKANAAFRQSVFGLFRDGPAALDPDTGELPQVFSDAFGEIGLEAYCLAVTPTQHAHLERWAQGQFVDDWPGREPAPAVFDDLDPGQQAAQLERAGLHDCLGGPFHPGIEITWTMRLPLVWRGPYRLAVAANDSPARQDWGGSLTPAVCTGAGGPFDGVMTGALTRFLGVPWQTDGASCNSQADYTPSYFLSMPTFWGPRVPDQVMSHETYARVIANAAAGRSIQSLKHFGNRSDWLRDIRSHGYLFRIDNMVTEWRDLGTVLPMDHDAATGLPARMHVEVGRAADFTRGDPKPELIEKCEGIDQRQIVRTLLRVDRAPGKPRRSFRHGEI